MSISVGIFLIGKHRDYVCKWNGKKLLGNGFEMYLKS